MDEAITAEVKGSTINIGLLLTRMDAASSGKFKNEIAQAWASDLTGATIDMTCVEFIDSSGVGALLGVYRRFTEGSTVTLKSMKPQVLSVIELLRLHRIFAIEP